VTEQLAVTLGCVRGENNRTLTFSSGTLNRGIRSMHARIVEPGRVGQCRFDRLDVEARERFAGGSDVWVHADRMVDGKQAQLASAAASLLNAEVGPAIREFGFHEAWLAGFIDSNNGRTKYTDPKAEEARCRWDADWWARADAVERRLARGELSVVIACHGETDRLQVDVAPVRSADRSWETVSALLTDVGGVTVGWLSESGRVVPKLQTSRPR